MDITFQNYPLITLQSPLRRWVAIATTPPEAQHCKTAASSGIEYRRISNWLGAGRKEDQDIGRFNVDHFILFAFVFPAILKVSRMEIEFAISIWSVLAQDTFMIYLNKRAYDLSDLVNAE